MGNKFRMLHNLDIVNPVRNMMVRMSDIKTVIFKSITSNTPFDMSVGSSYLMSVNGYLQWWESFAIDMEAKIKSTTESNKTSSIGYDDIKAFIYDEYDYGSITKFADGVIRGTKEGSMKSKSDVDTFFRMTARKAFGNRDIPTSTTGLLESVLVPSGLDIVAPNDYDHRMFKALKHSDKIFSSTDRSDIYNNVREVVNFLADNGTVARLLNTNNTSLYIAAVNGITDFVIYALTAYAVRIYAINLFAYPFINSVRSVSIDAMGESVVDLPHTKDVDESTYVCIMRNADEGELRSPLNFDKFKNLLFDATSAMGANGLIDHFDDRRNDTRTYVSNDELHRNEFYQRLASNELYHFITSSGTASWKPLLSEVNVIKETNWLIKSLTLATPTNSASAKNALLSIVRSIDCGNTVTECRKSFADMVLVSIKICDNIQHLIGIYSSDIATTLNSRKPDLSLPIMNGEISSILQELYSDIIHLFLQKGREIEMKFNKANGNNEHKNVGLNLPKSIPSEHGTTSNITNAVPDTIRVPVELSTLYALPAFEYFQFYDEAVKHKYGLENDLYFSEAFNINEIVNKVKAFLKGIAERTESWWQDGKRKQAIAWATKYGDTVTKKDFTNASMDVLPFKNNGSQEHIDLVGIVDKLVNGLSGFKADVVNSPESVENYIKSLYPDDKVYEWFKNENNKGEAAAKFHSFILFKDINSVSTAAENVVKITGPEISKRSAWWVDTCKGAQAIHQELVNINTKITQAYDKIQKDVASITANASPAKESLASAGNTNDDKGNNKDKETQQQNADKATNVSILLTSIQQVIMRIYDPLVRISMEYVDTEYRYLRTAYGLGEDKK